MTTSAGSSGNGAAAGSPTPPEGRAAGDVDIEVAVVGAGFAGLYLLHRLREMGRSAIAFEGAEDIGGTWYWNRYPGARCDIQSIDYSYSFDPELEDEWEWSEKYATQPEILRYLDFVAEKYDLRRDIRFSTRVDQATWEDDASRWRLRLSTGEEVTCRHYVMATGCLSIPKDVDIEGHERFGGESYFTSRWPHEGVDFTGKRVAVIGTGSSAIQSIPIIAREASDLTVFQRTPNFSMPAHNGPIPADKREEYDRDRAAYREEARMSLGGVPLELGEVGALEMTEEERQERFDWIWAKGELMASLTAFSDTGIDVEANELLSEYFRSQIRSIVDDPQTAELLCPTNHPFGTKRPCLDTGYFATYNLPHVHLVDLRTEPIESITETGIDTSERSFEFDAIVYATGFDAMTGALVGVDITGRGGVTLKERWAEGPKTYLGLTAVGFPNLYMITGPQSPSVLSNMAVSIEQHVDWISDCIEYMAEHGYDTIEPTPIAEEGWITHVNDVASLTLYSLADSWYMGANVPGKPRVFLPYVGGVGAYRIICDEVVEADYLGFELKGPCGTQRNDGVVRRVMPDVALVLEAMAELDLPPIESMSPDEARAFMDATNAERPPGPEVGEVVDGTLPGASGALNYRLYRPDTAGPHPIVVYYHGGGWVLGSQESDDPFCRDLCARSGALVVSVDYRHAPEHRFPSAVDDAFAALQWVSEHAAELGGDADRLAVCGWSAGGNLAAVVCQLARDAGGPRIAGQVLINPVTDRDHSRPSYSENGEDFILTLGLMRWFWDHYADPDDRSDPRASPLLAESLADLPPALVVTAEFDPLRDEGQAYAEALVAAGVDARHLPCRGQMHTSITSVGVVVTADGAREEIAQAIRTRLASPVPV